MAPDNTPKPATPRRTTPMQALSGLFRTPARLRTPTTVSRPNKRTRARTSSLSSTPSTPNTTSLPPVVLQTYSVSTDSIILTALPSVPFCCHEDLLTMSRAQLEGVVRALNAHLPRRMRIGPEVDFWNDGENRTGECDEEDDGLSRMSEAEMKRRVEELVGIRAVVGKNRVSRSGLGLDTRTRVPPAPKAVRTRDATWRPAEIAPWEMEVDAAEDHSDDLSITSEDALVGSSPLASRTKPGQHVRGRNHTLSRLAILQEENEGAESKDDDSDENETRPPKRQRVSFGCATLDSEGGSQIVQDVGGSRLVENMNLSGSPLLARDDDTSFENWMGNEQRVVATTLNQDYSAKTPEEGVGASLERRRSIRIKEIALKRMSSVGTREKTTSHSGELKSSLLRSKTFSSRRSSRNVSTSFGESDSGKVPGAPRELRIRLPFTSTPPNQKPNSLAWSAPRTLRSHSQRLLNASQSMKKTSSLGRSQSERYPRASDLAFVTVNRPRYRFMQRKSKGAKVAKEDQGCHLLGSTTSEYGTCQDIQICTEQPDGRLEHEIENGDPKITTRSPATADFQLHTPPSALCGLLTSRSRAPSTSTVTSSQDNCGDSPVRLMVKEEMVPTAITDSLVGKCVTECVWEALGRMVVDAA